MRRVLPPHMTMSRMMPEYAHVGGRGRNIPAAGAPPLISFTRCCQRVLLPRMTISQVMPENYWIGGHGRSNSAAHMLISDLQGDCQRNSYFWELRSATVCAAHYLLLAEPYHCIFHRAPQEAIQSCPTRCIATSRDVSAAEHSFA